MGKWHIGANGKVGICKALKGKCPFGGESNHFDSKEKAQTHLEQELQNEYGLLANQNKKMTYWELRDLSRLVEKTSKSRTRGFGHECFASVNLAEKMGLNTALVVKSDGSTSTIDFSKGVEVDNDTSYTEKVSSAVEILDDHYKKVGATVKDKKALARIVYYDKNNLTNGMLVQSGGSNVLDAAIIKDSKVSELIEIKELTNGAQLSASTLSVDKEGFVIDSTLKKQNKYTREAVSGFNIKEADGTNVDIDFGSRKRNKLLPLLQFVKQYKQKGANSLLYSSDNGKVVNKVSLEGTNTEVINRLIDNKISAVVTLRANMATRKPTEEDIERFVKDKDLFKEGRTLREDGTFTLQDIKKEKISKSGENIRVGSFVVNSIKYKDYIMDFDKPIRTDDLRAFALTLTGKISSTQTKEDVS